MSVRKAIPIALLSLLALTVWLPLYMLSTGVLMGAQEVTANIGPALTGEGVFAAWPIIPAWPTLRPLVELLLDKPAFFAMFWNACKIAIPAVLGQVLVAVPAAWGLARCQFRGKGLLYMLYVVLMLMPFQVMMTPSYLVLSQMRLLDTHWAVVLPAVFSAFPVFVLHKFFAALPEGLMEAAALDGAGPLRACLSIGVPLGMPGILSVVVLGFLENWSAIEQPLTFLRDKARWPLSLFLSSIAAQDVGSAFSASLIAMLPALLIFLWGQPYLEEGIRAAGLKE